MGLRESIVLISSGQPSANPRLVKEALALQQAGYNLTVIYVPISPWADGFDEQLIKTNHQIKFLKAGYHPSRQQWFFKWARLRRKLNSFLSRFIGNVFNAANYSTILFGQELLKTAKQHNADLYIAHNLGALPIAIKAANYHNAKIGFDAEDFHRGEFADNSTKKRQTEFIENNYFHRVDYLTVSSPLIGEAYKKIFSEISPVVINNVFPISSLLKLTNKEKEPGISLFWFSQTVGKKRGIEIIIMAMGLMQNVPVSLTLLGNTSADMKDYLMGVSIIEGVRPEQINFLPPVPEEELFKIASKFDIGLCSEVPYCLNRDYCLTNKIFTYLIAGNALILSDTRAQRSFLEKHPEVGLLYKYDDHESLSFVLSFYAKNKNVLEAHQRNARSLAEKELNWETESQKLLSVVASVLSE